MKTTSEMAREVKMPYDFVTGEPINLEKLKAFETLVRADEREACAKVCDDIDVEYKGEDVLATWCSRAIRARNTQ
jgi:hypothetical protein